MQNVDELLDQTAEKSANIDGWMSRNAALKIQKVRGKNLPSFVKENMRGMTEAERNKYRKKLLAQRAKRAKLRKKADEAEKRMKRKVIERRIRNRNLLESWKERKKQNLRRSKLAKIKAENEKAIARRNMDEQKALAVRNSTQPGVIKSQAEKRRMLSSRAKSGDILRGNDIFDIAVQPTSSQTPSNGTPKQWIMYVQSIMEKDGEDSDTFRQAVLGIPQDVINKMGPNIRRKIQRLRNMFSNPSRSPMGRNKLTTTQCENLKSKIKRHFLETVARARSADEASDKMNIMRQFWDKWQPVLSNRPRMYKWFINDTHIKNAMMDFKGIGEWDEFTPEESKYLNGAGAKTNEEKKFLLGDRPGVVDVEEYKNPIAGSRFDVEDLIPSIPSPQPDLNDPSGL